MKAIKRIFLGLLIVIVLLVGALAAVPYLFKDQLIAKTKTIINQNVNAEVDFGAVGLSVFRHFPDLTLSLNEFSVKGIDEFQDVHLARADELAFISGPERQTFEEMVTTALVRAGVRPTMSPKAYQKSLTRRGKRKYL